MSKCKVCKEKFTPQFSSLEPVCQKQSCREEYWKQKKTKPKAASHKIPKVSKKRKIENLQYSADRLIFLSRPENKICPITGTTTTDVHHKKGRIGSLLLNQKYWLAVSREGHQKIEENPEWAKEMGYSLNRLSNE